VVEQFECDIPKKTDRRERGKGGVPGKGGETGHVHGNEFLELDKLMKEERRLQNRGKEEVAGLSICSERAANLWRRLPTAHGWEKGADPLAWNWAKKNRGR